MKNKRECQQGVSWGGSNAETAGSKGLPSHSHKCLRFGLWSTLCTIKYFTYIHTYILTYLLLCKATDRMKRWLLTTNVILPVERVTTDTLVARLRHWDTSSTTTTTSTTTSATTTTTSTMTRWLTDGVGVRTSAEQTRRPYFTTTLWNIKLMLSWEE